MNCFPSSHAPGHSADFKSAVSRISNPHAAPQPCAPRRCSALQFWLWALLLLVAVNPAAAQADSPSEYQVKAAFLYNFAKFVEWPDTAFASPQAPLVIGVFRDDPFQGDLNRIIAGKNIGGHPVVARLVSTVADLKNCHIVFVSVTREKEVAEISTALAGLKVLTVTENLKHFADSGFMINFVMQDKRIGFQINNPVAARAGLHISSKLLSLARPLSP